MTNPAQRSTSVLCGSLRVPTFAMALICLLTMLAIRSAQAQTFRVIHNFTGQNDGGYPNGNLAIDGAGDLYDTAAFGQYDLGIVFKLMKRNSSWLLTPLYAFQGGADGAYPYEGVTLDQNGTVYAIADYGGLGCGIVANLRPSPARPPTPISPWEETVLHSFNPDQYGCTPNSTVTLDQFGNLYGVLDYSGPTDRGLPVYRVNTIGFRTGHTRFSTRSRAMMKDGPSR